MHDNQGRNTDKQLPTLDNLIQQFLIEGRGTKTKGMTPAVTTQANNTMRQSDFEANTTERGKTRASKS